MRSIPFYIYLFLAFPLIGQGEVDDFHSHKFETRVGCNEAFPGYSFKVTSEYDIGNTFLLLQAGRLTQEPPELIYEQLERWGFSSTDLIGENKARAAGYFARHEKFNLLAMRGTDTVFEGVMDGFFAQVPARLLGFRGLTHSGFSALYRNYQSKIKKLLKTSYSSEPNKPLVITGHSLGGVLARMAALDAVKQKVNVLFTHVMASPRIGNDDFRTYFDKQRNFPVYMTSHRKDITPHLPPTKLNFSHFANLIGEIIPQLKNFIGGAVQWLNYDSHVLQGMYTFDNRGVEKRTGDGASEQDYWQYLTEQLMAHPWTHWPSIIAQHSAEVHDPDRYLCALTRLQI